MSVYDKYIKYKKKYNNVKKLINITQNYNITGGGNIKAIEPFLNNYSEIQNYEVKQNYMDLANPNFEYIKDYNKWKTIIKNTQEIAVIFNRRLIIHIINKKINIYTELDIFDDADAPYFDFKELTKENFNMFISLVKEQHKNKNIIFLISCMLQDSTTSEAEAETKVEVNVYSHELVLYVDKKTYTIIDSRGFASEYQQNIENILSIYLPEYSNKKFTLTHINVRDKTLIGYCHIISIFICTLLVCNTDNKKSNITYYCK